MSRRRGLSPIVAELLLVAITVTIGSSLFFVASQSIGGYTNGFSLLFNQNANAAKEIYVVEYAQFNSGSNVTVTIRNVGYIEAEISAVSLFNLTSAGGSPTSGVYTLSTASAVSVVAKAASPYCSVAGTTIVIPVGTFCTVSVPFSWNTGTAYNIIVSSARGNSVNVQEVA